MSSDPETLTSVDAIFGAAVYRVTPPPKAFSANGRRTIAIREDYQADQGLGLVPCQVPGHRWLRSQKPWEIDMARPAWLDAPTTAKIGSGLFLVVESPADPFIERMEDEPNLRDQLFLATRALRHDPGCIEAHLLLAEYAARFHQRMAHIGKAVATGSAPWVPVVKRGLSRLPRTCQSKWAITPWRQSSTAACSG
jgi:hypothetical protein